MQYSLLAWTLLFLQNLDVSSQAGITKLVFVYGQYTLQSPEKAREEVFKNLLNLPKHKFGNEPAKLADFKFYHPQGDHLPPPLADVGMLYMTQPGPDPKVPGSYFIHTCTASYVGENILLTAAHCIVRRDLKIKPEDQLIYFVQDYNGRIKYEQKEWDDYGRIVTDWWLPEKFYNNYDASAGSETWNFDFAYLKVDKPNSLNLANGKPSHYNLVAPDEPSIKQNMETITVGYPGDVPGFWQGIGVYAKLHSCKDSQKFDLGPKFKCFKDVLVHVGSELGVHYQGASGGPIFRKAQGDNAEKMREVIGLLSFGTETQDKAKALKDKTPIRQEAMASPRIRPEMLDILGFLRQGPAGEAEIKAVVKRSIMATMCGLLCQLYGGDKDFANKMADALDGKKPAEKPLKPLHT